MSTLYKCYLNGKFYGFGNLEYMKELFVDYVVLNRMYGRDEVDFKIIKEVRDKNNEYAETIRKEVKKALEENAIRVAEINKRYGLKD
ncbi:hypothetical protein C0966_16920 (plasmid) [Bacillus methanolicus]|uniref:hypothetical protein n=1 Tax=Bacillus methanolicus TaxID=1471 RepID=UPI00237FE662|nr:hypothetical protein [Bacillus methanolicus]MDE3840950.1 hypothetical protein [Bacillus methanolicus]